MNYSEVIALIEAGEAEPRPLSHKEYHAAHENLLKELEELDPSNHEERGKIYYYLQVLGLRHYNEKVDTLSAWFELMLENFLNQEKADKKFIKQKGKKKDNMPYLQLLYFYKFVEHYFEHLEEQYNRRRHHKLSQKAYKYKTYFLHNHQLLEGKYMAYFVHKRQVWLKKIENHYLVYSFIGSIGVIMLFYGMTGIIEQIPIIKNPYVAFFLSLTILAFSGLLFAQFGKGGEGPKDLRDTDIDMTRK